MELDWIQNSFELNKRFESYLNILENYNHKQIMLSGVVNIIDITVRWRLFSQADTLLQNWVEKTVQSFNSKEILSFSEYQHGKRKYWIIINLLENYLKSKDGLDTERFDILAMKYILRLSGYLTQNLIKLADKTLSQAMKSYSDLEVPNELQKSIKNKLDQINSGAKENN